VGGRHQALLAELLGEVLADPLQVGERYLAAEGLVRDHEEHCTGKGASGQRGGERLLPPPPLLLPLTPPPLLHQQAGERCLGMHVEHHRPACRADCADL
jgi:hypothetical protein